MVKFYKILTEGGKTPCQRASLPLPINLWIHNQDTKPLPNRDVPEQRGFCVAQEHQVAYWLELITSLKGRYEITPLIIKEVKSTDYINSQNYPETICQNLFITNIFKNAVDFYTKENLDKLEEELKTKYPTEYLYNKDYIASARCKIHSQKPS